MGTVNKVILVGRLGADPELKTTPSGKAVCNLSLATDEGTKDSKRTEWHRLTCWDKTAENAGKFLSKGREVYVEGRLQTRSYDAKDGTKKYSTDIVVERLVFLSGGKGEGKPGAEVDSGDEV